MRLIDADKLETHEFYDGIGFAEAVYMDDIREMPTVDTERHGHWVIKEEEREVKGTITPVYWHECSVCGEKPLYTDNGIWVFSNYCPNCGAKMDEVEEDEIDRLR